MMAATRAWLLLGLALLSAAPATHAAPTTINAASLVIDTSANATASMTMTLTLTLAAAVDVVTVPWNSSLALREGFFVAEPLLVLARSPASGLASSVAFSLRLTTHKTTAYDLDYALVLVDPLAGVLAFPAAASTLAVAATRINGSTPYPGPGDVLVPERVCSSVLGDVFVVGRIDSRAKFEEIGQRRCTIWTGALELTGLALTPAEWYAGLGSLVEIEGYLLVDGCTNFQLHHLASLQRLAAVVPATLLRENGEDHGLVVRNCINFDPVASLQPETSFLDRINDGRVVLQNNSGMCLPQPLVSTRWWGNPHAVFLSHPLSACAGNCFMHTDTARDACVSWCATCPQTCEGRVVSAAADLAAYATANCSYISGFLTIEHLQPDVLDADLEVFAGVTQIEGLLRIVDNRFLVGLEFLRNLVSVPAIVIVENDALVDARLPQLVAPSPSFANNSVTVVKNRVLCTEAWPLARGAGSGPCSDVDIVHALKLTSTPNTDAAALLSLPLLRSSAAQVFGCNVANVTAEITMPNASNVYVRLTLRVVGEGSWAAARAQQTAIVGGQLASAVAASQPAFVAVTAASTASPQRLVAQPPAYDTGVSLDGLSSLSDVALTWTDPTDTALISNSSIITFNVEYIAQPSPAAVSAFVDFFVQQNMISSSLSSSVYAQDMARGAIDLLTGWQQLSNDVVSSITSAGVGSTHVLSVPTCEPVLVNQSLVLTSNCLASAQTYDFRVTAYAGSESFVSNIYVASVLSTGYQVTGLAVAALGPTTLRVRWSPPASVSPANTIVSYRVQIRYHAPGNARWDAWYIANYGGQGPAELDPLFTKQLLNGSALANAAELDVSPPPQQQQQELELVVDAGSLLVDASTGLPAAIRPWTRYKVTVQVIGSAWRGLVASQYVTTAEAVPDAPPQLYNLTVGSTQAFVDVNLPASPTGVMTGLTVFWADQVGNNKTEFVPVSTSLQQLQNTTRASNIFIRLSLSPLLPYMLHQANITAHTRLGAGPAAAPLHVSFTTAEGVPAQMAPPTVTQDSVTNLYTVRWVTPSPLPGIITKYRLFLGAQASDGSDGVLLYEGLATSVVLASLGGSSGDAASASLRVQAFTAAGGGPLSPSNEGVASSSNATLAIAAGIGAGIGLLVVVVLVLLLRRRLLARGGKGGDAEDGTGSRTSMTSLVKRVADGWEFDAANLTLGRTLGKGAFGVVCEAVAYDIREFRGPTRVAVKQCSGDLVTPGDLREFLAEADLMKKFSDPWHKNVVRLLGVCTQAHPYFIITELMEKGDLKSFLRTARPQKGRAGLVSLADLVYMASDVASGMHFLSSLQFVHRDLACRNCLVAANMTVKISDFGMSRDINYHEYYKKNGEALMPVRWMAPECLMDGIFSSRTDMWSMGVVLWEIITFCEVPYGTMTNQEVYERISRGLRLPQPPNCPDVLYEAMRLAWVKPNDRPTFEFMEETLITIAQRIELQDQSYITSRTATAAGDLVAADSSAAEAEAATSAGMTSMASTYVMASTADTSASSAPASKRPTTDSVTDGKMKQNAQAYYTLDMTAAAEQISAVPLVKNHDYHTASNNNPTSDSTVVKKGDKDTQKGDPNHIPLIIDEATGSLYHRSINDYKMV